MNTFFSKLKQFASSHKIVTVVVLIIIAWGAYAAYGAASKAPTVTKYVVQAATQDTVIASVSGSGQVQAQSTVAVKSQNSENVTAIYVQPGQHVAAGQLLIQLDTTNEQKALTSAQLSLQSAQLALEKLQQVSTSTVLQDQSAMATAQQNLANASASIEKDYQSGYDTLTNTFVDLQSLMSDVNDFMAGTEIDKAHDNPDALVDVMPNYLQTTAASYRNELSAAYTAAVTAYQQNVADFHATNENATQATLNPLFTETYNTTKDIGSAIKSATDLLDYDINNYPSAAAYVSLPATVATYQTSFGGYTNTINSDISNVNGIVTAITNDQQSLTNNQNSLIQANENYNELVAGPNPLDVQSQNISIESAQLSLQTAQQNLAYDSIRAPIAGIVSSIPSVVGETVASPAVDIVSDGQVAEITLNEIDAAKVQLNDKATLTFDALPDVSLAGNVIEIDPVGTVSAGVVNYNVQIGFTQPTTVTSTDLVKPGMSVTADLVTQADQNVVAVPNSAVHAQGTTSYVLEPATPLSATDLASAATGIELSGGTKMVTVTTGISNDTETEITSGLNPGDQYITQTITTSGTTSAGSTAAAGGTNALRALGGGAGAFGGGGGFTGGAVRVTGGGGGAARTGAGG